MKAAVEADTDSQFPFWDSVECNYKLPHHEVIDGRFVVSQFPFWDFVECNRCSELLPAKAEANSQFPFWDFVECNPMPFRLFFGELAGKISGSYRLPRSCNGLYKDKKTI